jgi:rhodanese-related sulfurtransferase
MKLLREVLLLTLLAGLAAVASYFLNPKRPELYLTEEKADPGEITLKDAMVLAKQGKVLWIDARRRAEYEKGHIPEALLLNEFEWNEQLSAAMPILNDALEKHVIVYCDALKCAASKKIAEEVRQFFPDPENVLVLRGGWPVWHRENP